VTEYCGAEHDDASGILCERARGHKGVHAGTVTFDWPRDVTRKCDQGDHAACPAPQYPDGAEFGCECNCHRDGPM
jgi:hypothetical protein